MIANPGATAAGNGPRVDEIGGRMIVASRYADCLYRLARQAYRFDMADLGAKLNDVARAIEANAHQIGVDDRGVVVLSRASRLIGAVEAIVEKTSKKTFLH
ncbi:hypothetical protein [Rhizobium grahamii]|uniref:Uncharacterized protein n=1 Tax=Rhizobium grahamii CCGE 502 TaxID=990285 RepID=S3HV48_9HYPH|nr:hypothetical protein [Rhizobium grahamii]EPE97056.1 hypothetical protein RGCCGE502_16870 [Rhizobium grahamii CCGE 502]